MLGLALGAFPRRPSMLSLGSDLHGWLGLSWLSLMFGFSAKGLISSLGLMFGFTAPLRL